MAENSLDEKTPLEKLLIEYRAWNYEWDKFDKNRRLNQKPIHEAELIKSLNEKYKVEIWQK